MPLRVAVVALAITTLGGCASSSDVPIPTPAALSTSESETILAEQLAQSWKMYGADGEDRPEIPVVRTISRSEWGEVMAACMAEQGFSVTIGSDGGMGSGDLPESQAGAYNLAIYVCDASYPLDPKYSAPLNESQQRYLFDYLTTDLVECLEDQGFDTGSAPSWQKFAEGLESGTMWNPFTALPDVSPKRFQEIESACPQSPPRLYG
ncbi:hypothetical protein ATC03_00185 [Agromyces aureus]|uniref:Uncharacterized protein n=2 Tax=Agromyces aureus TaxID=453304 RepID=A0A191WB09_9MICO|nr:hypothetical protein ATC03_00185 [Agromyces aureus]